MTTLAELWSETFSNSKTENAEIRHLETLLARNRALLEKSFTNEQETRWEIFADCEEEYRSLLCEQAFCIGFRLGMKLSIEALGE